MRRHACDQWSSFICYILPCLLRKCKLVPKIIIRIMTIFLVSSSSGIHVRNSDCDLKNIYKNLQKMLAVIKPDLFPSVLKAGKPLPLLKPIKPNGGWSDWRDRQLCASIANFTDTSETISRLQFLDVVLW